MEQANLFAYERSQRPEFKNTTADKVELDMGRVVGHIGRDKGRGKPNRAYLTQRQRSGSNNHYSEECGGFPLSTIVLEKCESYKVNEILVIDKDTGQVFEFTLNDYLQGIGLDEIYENHRCVPLNSRRHEWRAEEIFQ